MDLPVNKVIAIVFWDARENRQAQSGSCFVVLRFFAAHNLNALMCSKDPLWQMNEKLRSVTQF